MDTSAQIPVPSLHEPISTAAIMSSPTFSSHSSSDEASSSKLQRPKLGSRKSSGTMIIPRESQQVEMDESEEEYDEGDVRSMSPRRTVEAVEQLGQHARQSLIEYAAPFSSSITQGLMFSAGMQRRSKQVYLLLSTAWRRSKRSMRNSRAATNFSNRQYTQVVLLVNMVLTCCRYIGELIQTSKITSAPQKKGKGRNAK